MSQKIDRRRIWSIREQLFCNFTQQFDCAKNLMITAPIFLSLLQFYQQNFGSSIKKIGMMQQESQHYKLRRTLILQDEDSERIQLAQVDFDHNAFRVHLQPILKALLNDHAQKHLRIYDFQHQVYVTISVDDCSVPVDFLGPNQCGMFLVKVRRLQRQSVCSTNSVASHQRLQVASESSSFKRERSKQRVIFEVIEIVKQWRQLHLSRNNPRKVSLQEAAKMVGLPKKSLDDYYYQLRLGEKYDFDFKAHLFDRIGVLRTFLKDLKRDSKLDKTEKHPKRLKIIENFQQLSNLYSAQRQLLLIEDYPRDMQEEMVMKIEEQYEREGEQAGAHEDEVSLQDHFYNEFEYMLNDKDPFLSCDFNFKKKALEDNNSEELFF